MRPSDIFKMEFYKNFRDKAWLIIIGSLAAVALITTILGISLVSMIQSNNYSSNSGSPATIGIVGTLFATLAIFGGLGYYAFTLVYPFHLLSTDYNNKTLSLMVASGVKRTNYYFIKFLATLLSNLMAIVVIWLLPLILVLGAYGGQIVGFIQHYASGFQVGSLIFFLFVQIFASIATVASLFFWVILTRGKFWSIFIYLGVGLFIGIFTGLVNSTIMIAYVNATDTLNSGPFGVISSFIGLSIALIEIVVFGLLSLMIIRKQDL